MALHAGPRSAASRDPDRQPTTPELAAVEAHDAVHHRHQRVAHPDVGVRNVPQLVAEDDYLELVATALPGTAVAAGRRFSALALAGLLGEGLQQYLIGL
jgi:hypothetical protein